MRLLGRGTYWAGIGLLCSMLALRVAGQPHAGSDAELDRIIDAMPVRARLAQLLLVGVTGSEMNDEVRRLVDDWRVGGLVLYAPNIVSPAHLRRLTSEIEARTNGCVPPFIAVDQEGGEVVRIADAALLLPGAMALGATRSPELALRAGQELASGLRQLGVTMNLAPVLDVMADPDAAIDIRSFGQDPDLVATLGAAFIEGQSARGIVSVAKHFPGLGRARLDSHKALPRIGITEDELQRDLIPFRAAIEVGVDAVLLGHAAFPRIDGDEPVMLSRKMISLLRDDLQFDGIIITDALQMDAVDRRQGVGRVAVRAILGGADMVMVMRRARDRDEVFEALQAAHRSGELTEDRLRASLHRILRAKQRHRLSHTAQSGSANGARAREVIAEIARRSVTLLRNEGSILPLSKSAPENDVVYIGPAGPIAQAAGATRTMHPPVRFTGREARHWSAQAAKSMAGARLLVAVAQNRAQMQVIRAAARANPAMQVVLVSLGSPQLLRLLPEAAAYVCAYGYLRPSQEAVARALRGDADAPGRLPVDVPGLTP